MGAQQLFAKRMIDALAATLLLAATAVCAHSQERPSPSAPLVGGAQSDKPQLPETSSGALKQDNSAPWTNNPRAFPPRRSVGADPDTSTEVAAPPDQFRLGNSYIGIQTQKSLQTPDHLRRSDCAKEEDCPDYLGSLPPAGPKTSVKSLPKPFIGLSITAPLRE